jgi:ABC-type lipoprotein export system ATPase subunit/ABC-type lipoprotein release transport system permease subunit
MIKIANLVKKYNDRVILDSLNMTFPDKGLVTLFGASGSGKTTLLNVIGGMDKDVGGEVAINGKDILKFDEDSIREYRLNNIGYVFQNFNLFNLETVYENVKMPLDSIAILHDEIKKRRVNDALQLLGIYRIRNQNVNKLSGGEKQRVAIARAIINSPKIILCDEPTGALDEKNSLQIYEILKQISKSILVIVASHDEAIKKYADKVLTLVDGKIVSQSENIVEDKKDFNSLIASNFKRKKPSLPFLFKCRHSYRKMKTKKFRSLIINGVLSMALTGIGVSLIISSSISSKIQNAFSSLTNGNQIVMNLKHENQNTISGAYSAPLDSAQKISESYPDEIEGIGASYLVNFENFFRDKNDFYITATAYKISIPSLSTRNINDFKWINKEYSNLTYPYVPTTLNNDEVILGLNYAEMVNICYQLQIQRNYASLGEYVRTHDFTISLEIANNYWQYEDEQVFTVKAITEANKSCFYHYNLRWNEEVFERMMLLPSIDDSGDQYYPWEMYKIYYFKTYNDPSSFINKSFYDKNLYDYVFERTNYSYNPGLCKINEVCKEKRVYIYYVDKSAVDIDILNQVTSIEKDLTNYFYVSDYGYASYASGMLNGFSKNVFVSLSRTKIDEAIDADIILEGDNNMSVALPEHVVGGNYLSSLNGGLRFSTKPKEFTQGRFPLHNGEIAISKGLAKQLGEDPYGKELFISGITSERMKNDGKIEKDYQTNKAVVVGIVDEDNPYLYHNGDWSISFFRDSLGISMFSLIPKAVIFELDSKVDSEKICTRLNKIFKNYDFTSPSLEISKSISSTLKYANVMLYSFSILAAIISVLLLATIVMLNVLESKEELELFRYLGIKEKDAQSTFIVQSLLHGVIAFAMSAIEIVVVDIMITKLLGNTFGHSLKYSFNPLPIAITFVIAIIISFVTSLVMVKLLSRQRRIIKK